MSILVQIHTLLYYNLFIHYQADICHETKNTLEFVSICPDTEPLKQRQSKKKQCARFQACNGEPLVYHCARYKERIVEVCTPIHFITGNFVFVILC